MAEKFQLIVIFVEDEPDAPLVRLDHTIGTLFVNLDKFYDIPERQRQFVIGHEVEHHLMMSNIRALTEAQKVLASLMLTRIGRNIEAACKEQGVTFKRIPNVYRNEDTGLYGFVGCESDMYETEADALDAATDSVKGDNGND